MSDAIRKDTEKLVEKVATDAKEQLKKLQKVKAMTKLARDLGEDTAMFDNLLDVSEGVLKDIAGKLIFKK